VHETSLWAPARTVATAPGALPRSAAAAAAAGCAGVGAYRLRRRGRRAGFARGCALFVDAGVVGRGSSRLLVAPNHLDLWGLVTTVAPSAIILKGLVTTMAPNFFNLQCLVTDVAHGPEIVSVLIKLGPGTFAKGPAVNMWTVRANLEFQGNFEGPFWALPCSGLEINSLKVFNKA
jgi:hypothetical protein